MRAGRVLAGALALGLAGPAIAQNAGDASLSTGIVQSQILTVDTERAFSTSLFGVRLEADIKTAAEALVAENTRIESELSAEEQALTEARTTLDPAEFREKADAFDTKVQAIRSEQDAKARDVQNMRDEGERDFLSAVTPILADIARERGAVLVFERQQILLSAESIDVTNEAITRLNAKLGSESPAAPEGSPEATPEAAPDAAPQATPEPAPAPAPAPETKP